MRIKNPKEVMELQGYCRFTKLPNNSHMTIALAETIDDLSHFREAHERDDGYEVCYHYSPYVENKEANLDYRELIRSDIDEDGDGEIIYLRIYDTHAESWKIEKELENSPAELTGYYIVKDITRKTNAE